MSGAVIDKIIFKSEVIPEIDFPDQSPENESESCIFKSCKFERNIKHEVITVLTILM